MGSFGTSRTARGSTVSEAVKRRAQRVREAFDEWNYCRTFDCLTTAKRPDPAAVTIGFYQDGIDVARVPCAAFTFTLATKDPA